MKMLNRNGLEIQPYATPDRVAFPKLLEELTFSLSFLVLRKELIKSRKLWSVSYASSLTISKLSYNRRLEKDLFLFLNISYIIVHNGHFCNLHFCNLTDLSTAIKFYGISQSLLINITVHRGHCKIHIEILKNNS